MEKDKIVTYRTIASYFGVAHRVAQSMAIKTRAAYDKEPKEKITLGQVLKANNLEA